MDTEVIGPLAGLGGAILGFIGGQINGHRKAKSKREELEAGLKTTTLELNAAQKAREEVQEKAERDRQVAGQRAERAAALQVQSEKDEARTELAKAIEDVISGIQANLLSAHVESKARDATAAVKGSSKFDESSNVKRAARKLDEALADKGAMREVIAMQARDLLNA